MEEHRNDHSKTPHSIRRVRLRAAVIIIGVVLASSAVTTAIGIHFSTREISYTVSQDLTLVEQLAFDMISSSLGNIGSDANYVGNMMAAAFESGGKEGLARTLEAEVGPGPSFISLGVVFADGGIYSAEKEGYGYSKPPPDKAEDFFREAPDEGIKISGLEETASGQFVIRCYTKVRDDAVFMSALPSDYFSQLITNSDYRVYDAARVFLVDGQGYTIADSTDSSLNTKFDPSSDSNLSRLVFSCLASDETGVKIANYRDDGAKYICAYTPIVYNTERWALFLNMPESETPIPTIMRIFITSGLIFLVFGVIAAIFLSHMQTRPYVELDKRNEELAILKERAEYASVTKSEYLSSMSHEIRTPLNAVIGMTGIAQNATDVKRKDYCLSKIEESSRHLMGVINDVLDISKIEANKFELDEISFRFEDMLKKVAGVIAFKVDEKAIRFKVSSGDGIPRSLRADEQRLSQVITNLLSNAVKFTPEGGDIRLESRLLHTEADTAEIEISVSDSGIGISEEQQGRLFRAFTQADSSISRKFGGTGLGLTISKRIVEMMGGDISVESRVGEGSKFTFTFKAQIAADEDVGADTGKAPEDVAADTPYEGAFRGKRILLAEDVDVNREIVIALLEPTGAEITEAENGRLAVDMFKAEQDSFDLILMDVQMPELDGYGATAEIRALGTDKAVSVPIIAMTANVFREDIDRCLEIGMNDHIGKPFNFDQVMDMLRKYLCGP
ncbi:MAG: response regulator [Clostridiales Family XIII bacterium]|jgi:signal transduction histidine kinase|nr:response regulator [Clostridiales Family XIII bacterium]